MYKQWGHVQGRVSGAMVARLPKDDGHFLGIIDLMYERRALLCFFVGWAISRCLSSTPHPIEGQGGRILLVHYFLIILKPAIVVFNGGSELPSQVES